MSRFFLGLALCALLLAFAACGGDSKGTDPVRVAELAEMDDTDVSSSSAKAESSSNETSESSSGAKSQPSSSEVKASSSSDKSQPSSNETSESSSGAKSSNSKDGKSSSSDEKNSSSSSVVPTNSSSSSGASTVSVASPCKTEAEDNCEYGALTDDRDGQTYKTVKIGEQWWMAENLNYAYTGVPFKYVLSTESNLVYYSDSTSWCFNDSAEYCTKYGRLYTWSAAMDSSGILPGNAANGCGYDTICSPTYPVRGVCPEGWHLPDSTEWFTLFTAVGGKATAGMVLRSTEGWNDIIDNNGNKYDSNGSDNFGFSALPVGRVRASWLYDNEGIHANFWSSTEYKSRGANIVCLNRGIDYAHWFTEIKDEGYSVRCVKD